jgi:hypothetical protein
MQRLLAFCAYQVLWLAPAALCQSADLPAAPGVPLSKASEPSDSPSSKTKPSLTLPPLTYERPTVKAPAQATTPEEFCSADPLKLTPVQPIPKEIQGEVRNYEQEVFNAINTYLIQHRHIVWSRERTSIVYFTIKPDGSYTMPVLVSSSGKSEFDGASMSAIHARDMYPPLPRGMTEPLKLCNRFLYNMHPEHWQYYVNYGNWQGQEPAKQ